MEIITRLSVLNKRGAGWSPVLLRLVMGVGFFVHGYAKLSRGPAGFAKLLALSGVPMPHLMAWVGSLTELIGGTALILGLFVSLISIPLLITMLVAMFTVQIHYGFSSVNTIGLNSNGALFGPPGYEINLLYIAGLIILITGGGGKFALEQLFFKQDK